VDVVVALVVAGVAVSRNPSTTETVRGRSCSARPQWAPEGSRRFHKNPKGLQANILPGRSRGTNILPGGRFRAQRVRGARLVPIWVFGGLGVASWVPPRPSSIYWCWAHPSLECLQNTRDKSNTEALEGTRCFQCVPFWIKCLGVAVRFPPTHTRKVSACKRSRA